MRAARSWVACLAAPTQSHSGWRLQSSGWMRRCAGTAGAASYWKGLRKGGRRRQCRYARLATGHYQAPPFYAHLGYQLYGRLDDCPPGEVVSYYWKALLDSTAF